MSNCVTLMKAIVCIKEVNNKAWQVINFSFSYKLQNKYEVEKGNPCNDPQSRSQERIRSTSINVQSACFEFRSLLSCNFPNIKV